ncbi:MAG: hypothetical protein QG654_509 [Patescibacteria group bacterium]|nr:hypothetical protein [Patescibacteria group bacterium]
MENLDYNIKKTKENYKNIEEFGSNEEIKNIYEVFKNHPELELIGTKEEYSEYLKTIFPESLLSRIMWHGVLKNTGVTETIYKDGFNKEKNLAIQNNLEFHGFYFGDRYSHYGGSDMDSIPVVLNIKKPHLINVDYDGPTLSSLNVEAGLKNTYNLNEEDSIVQIGFFEGNDNISDEERGEYITELENQFNLNLEEEKDETTQAREILKFIRNCGFNGIPLQEVVVFDSSQIHILGSESDIQAFSDYKLSSVKPS